MCTCVIVVFVLCRKLSTIIVYACIAVIFFLYRYHNNSYASASRSFLSITLFQSYFQLHSLHSFIKQVHIRLHNNLSLSVFFAFSRVDLNRTPGLVSYLCDVVIRTQAGISRTPAYDRFWAVTLYLQSLNSSVNFILYIAISPNFRRQFLLLFCRHKKTLM